MRRQSRLVGILCVMLAGAVTGACASTQFGQRKLTYGQTAKTNYDKGMQELKDENYAEAVRFFNFVKTKFPFSRYSTLAELRVADALFEQEKYVAAADAYKMFINFHPIHPEVASGYAAFRACEAYIKRLPDDWFLIPPSREKDQTATKESLRELTGFLHRYPDSKYLKQANLLYRQCIRRLVSHELYVARFYLDRDKPKAAILRLEGVLGRYPDAGVDPEVMLLLGRTYLKLDQRLKAKKTFLALVQKYPNDASSAKAKLYLRQLNQQ